MNGQGIHSKRNWQAGVAGLIFAAALISGCKTQQATQAPERTDQQIANDIQAKMQGEQALASQPIQVSVASGMATLSGTVSDEASRALAGNDSGSVAGVKTVVNNLTVQTAQRSVTEPPRPEAPMPAPPPRRSRQAQNQGPQPMAPPAPAQPVASAPMQPRAPQPPPPPPQPVARQVVIPAGTQVQVRMAETLDSKTSQTNDVFHATLARDLVAQGLVAIPHGAPVLGRVVNAKQAGHFKGNAVLEVELTEMTAHDQKIELTTNTYNSQGAGRGKNTAEKAGGGAAVGALIGALAGGGQGAAIGALAGGGTGAGINAVTRGQQVQIPAETLVSFDLQTPIVVTVMVNPSGSVQSEPAQEPQLLRR